MAAISPKCYNDFRLALPDQPMIVYFVPVYLVNTIYMRLSPFSLSQNLFLLVFIMLTGFACNSEEGQKQEETPAETQPSTEMKSTFDLQGHRGCRGLLPENTLPAFLHAVDLGVTTLELDVVITSDKEVLVSHEPFFSHEICLNPNGAEIPESEEKTHNIYTLSLAECQAYDCGSKFVERFPDQQKMKVSKPSLREVFATVEEHVKQKGLPPVRYNIETKSKPEGDDLFHPQPAEFVELLYGVIQEAGTQSQVSLQSFDVRTLQVAQEKELDLTLVLLVENEEGAEANLQALGFTPDVYSPWFKLIGADLPAFCRDKGMQLIPWTVNEEADIHKMLDLGVDGLISDYPDRVLAIRKGL